jgi:hypothetical protein
VNGWRDEPAAGSLLLFGGLIVAGFVAVYLGYREAAHTSFAPSQLPALISGGLGGLALVLLGSGLLNIQLRRRLAATRRAANEAALEELSALIESLKQVSR